MKIIPVKCKDIFLSPFYMIKDLSKMVHLAFTPTQSLPTISKTTRHKKYPLPSEPMYKPSKVRVADIKKKLDAVI